MSVIRFEFNMSPENLTDLNWFVCWYMVFNATFKNISAISWRSVLLVVETRVPGENKTLTNFIT